MKLKIFFMIAVVALFSSCQNKPVKAEGSIKEKSCCAVPDEKLCCTSSTSIPQTGVQVIYFHNERRCATCMAIEEGAQALVLALKDSSITFNSYLIGDPKSAEFEKGFKVEGQTLIVVGKRKVTDLTNMAFMNARVKPDMYKAELKAAIEKQK